MFPIIPLLAVAAIIGGVCTLSWYSQLSRAEQKRANSLALKWFGRQFQQLSQRQQQQIKDLM